jgi:voltage-gated potassium channel
MKDLFDKKVLKTKPQNFSPFRDRLHEIIFEAETREGKLFDVLLLVMIFLSIMALMLESVPEYYESYKSLFLTLEWVFTIFFTIEFLLRLYCVYSPKHYILSFFGIVDLLSLLPSYLTYFVPGMHSLMIIRGLRLLRVFRIFKLDGFIDQGNIIIRALHQSRNKIIIFSSTILILVSIFGSLMYLIEHNVNPNFDSIPRSIYWSIVTITTVGYGDISPTTSLGQFIASIIMLLGYVIIAIPTGIVTSAIIMDNNKEDINTITCPNCAKEGHDDKAVYCDRCGHAL